MSAMELVWCSWPCGFLPAASFKGPGAKTKKDYAEFMKSLAASCPDAEKIVLVH